MTALHTAAGDRVGDPSELAGMMNDIYRRLAVLEVAIKMTRQSEAR